jgi:hypothetical protein
MISQTFGNILNRYGIIIIIIIIIIIGKWSSDGPSGGLIWSYFYNLAISWNHHGGKPTWTKKIQSLGYSQNRSIYFPSVPNLLRNQGHHIKTTGSKVPTLSVSRKDVTFLWKIVFATLLSFPNGECICTLWCVVPPVLTGFQRRQLCSKCSPCICGDFQFLDQ